MSHDMQYKEVRVAHAASLYCLLLRLGLEYVDLYLMHSAMGGKTVETWTAMLELKKQGLIR